MKDSYSIMKKLVKNFEEVLCSFFLVTMVFIVIANVFSRYLFDSPIYWAEEVATISFVWLVFVGASAVYKNKMDIGIDVIIKKLPHKLQSKLVFLVYLLLLGINGSIFYLSIIFTKSSLLKPMPVLGISSAVVNLALVVGFGLITFHTLRFIKQGGK